MTTEALLILSHFQMRKRGLTRIMKCRAKVIYLYFSATVAMPLDPQSKTMVILVAL